MTSKHPSLESLFPLFGIRKIDFASFSLLDETKSKAKNTVAKKEKVEENLKGDVMPKKTSIEKKDDNKMGDVTRKKTSIEEKDDNKMGEVTTKIATMKVDQDDETVISTSVISAVPDMDTISILKPNKNITKINPILNIVESQP